MASYQFISPTKVKLYAEFGYRDDGTRARKTKTVSIKTPNSERAAQRALERFIEENADKHEPAKRITFKRFVDDWLELHVSKLHIGTKRLYKSCLRNGILDYFGDKQMAAIRPLHVVRFFKEEEEKGHGMVKNKYICLCSIFSRAEKWEVISNNPMRKVDLKDLPEAKHRKRERKWYNAEELAAAIKAIDSARWTRAKTKIAFKLAALGGLREAEIAGLRNEAINFTDNSLLIDRQLIWDSEEKRFRMVPTKNGKSRTVYLPDKFMQGEFKAYVHEHNKIRAQCEDALFQFIDPDFSDKPVNLIITSGRLWKPIHPANLSLKWSLFVKNHNLPPLNFHGLRHSCLSYQINHGAVVTDVQRQAGHSTVKLTTGTYGHSEVTGRQAAANLLNDVL